MKPTTRWTNFSSWRWAYERKAPASLQGFMAWLRAADTEVKRDMEISRDEVRVMTVHGAKGLEAPVVFLVDTTTSPADTTRLKLVRMPQGNAAPHAPGVVVWAGKKAEDPPAVAAAREAMLGETEDEYRRLLYVAMTRAADRLIVAGCMPGNRNVLRPLSWYDLIEKGLGNSGLHMQNVPPPDGVVKRFSRARGRRSYGGRGTGPGFCRRYPLAGVAAHARSARAARRSFPAAVRSRRGRSRCSAAARRPNCAHARCCAASWCTGCCNRCRMSRPKAGARRRCDISPAMPDEWAEEERETLAAQVLSLIGDIRFASLFAPGSRAEVSIAGRLDRPGRTPVLVSGQIDRLAVTPAEVLIVDYKTNHAPPATVAEAPVAYIRQLALYRAVLAEALSTTADPRSAAVDRNGGNDGDSCPRAGRATGNHYPKG